MSSLAPAQLVWPLRLRRLLLQQAQLQGHLLAALAMAQTSHSSCAADQVRALMYVLLCALQLSGAFEVQACQPWS